MTNLEKYAHEIARIACRGQLFAVPRDKGRPIPCSYAICRDCLFYDARLDNNCSSIKRNQWAKAEC